MSQNPHILVIRLSAMGDVAMTVPVLRALQHQHPQIKITVLTRPFFKPFFRDLTDVKILEADLKGLHKGFLGLYRLSKTIKSLSIDAIADLHNVLRSNVLKLFLKGIPFAQIDKGRAEKKALISGKKFKPLKTTHQRYIDVFNSLGYSVDISRPIFPTKANLNSKLLAIMGDSKRPKIGMAPFAAHQSKMYPLEQMKQVIQTLSKDYDILLFGGGDLEIDVLSQWEREFENTITVAGRLTLDEELDIISNLDVMLSMDSGNAHIAAMMGVKTITVWGVTHPYAGFAPFNQPEEFCLLANREKFPKIPTSVYGNTYPEGYENVAGSISVETIVGKIRSAISK